MQYITGYVSPAAAKPSLVVFSHLRWSFVWQRPQHLLSRLARDFRIYFIEEPMHTEGEPRLEVTRTPSGVEVVVPHTHPTAPGFHDDHLATLTALLADFATTRDIVAPLVWLYTPMALPLAGTLRPRGLIYDCMDDLSSFKGAPRQMVQREAALLRLADLVLTGGPSLYEARRDRHPNIHCLPSAVDAAHFNVSARDPACEEALAAARLHEGLPRPRLGFFGVIDERLDIELLDRLAQLRPQHAIVMVGPVVKIDPALLPRHPNIHWLGGQRYESLPWLQAQWDVCILPFALNAATRFISPTKTLEYLAGDKPVVSTPLRDVDLLYGRVVRLAAEAEAFAAACDEALAESGAALERRRELGREIVRHGGWDDAARRVRELIGERGWLSEVDPQAQDAARFDALARLAEPEQAKRSLPAAG